MICRIVLSLQTSRSPTSPLRRNLIALTMGALLFFGVVAPHAPGGEHNGSPVGVEIDGAAQHPKAPLHFEASHPENHPACPVCLLQIQGRSLLSLPAIPPVPLHSGAVSTLVEHRASLSSPHLGPARAPPALSASA